MALARYLADTSAITRLSKPPVRASFEPRAVAGLVALCAPVAFELGYSARTPADHRAARDSWASYPWVPTNESHHSRALEIQSALAARSQHRAVSLVDALVAALAEDQGLVVLHYDADFELIAEVTGQRQEWVVPRGTAD